MLGMERLVIVGSKKSWISARLHRGERQKRVCALNEVLKIVSAAVYGFLC